MRRSFITAAFIALAIQMFSVGILAPRLPREVCRPGIESEKVFSLEPVSALRLVNVDGAAQISTSAAAKKITVAARVRMYTSTTEDQALAQTYLASLFQIKESRELATIITEPIKRPDPIDLRVDYTIEAPPGIDLSIDVSNGNIWVAPGCNSISITANNADVEVLDAQGDVSVKTINGRINAQKCLGETTLETINGSIQASLVRGALQASTTTGGITTTLLEGQVNACDLTSLNGSITLVMSEQASADVNAVTSRGSVRADLAVNPTGTPKRRELHGTLGEGFTNVSMNSMNGDIVIQRSAT